MINVINKVTNSIKKPETMSVQMSLSKINSRKQKKRQKKQTKNKQFLGVPKERNSALNVAGFLTQSGTTTFLLLSSCAHATTQIHIHYLHTHTHTLINTYCRYIFMVRIQTWLIIVYNSGSKVGVGTPSEVPK